MTSRDLLSMVRGGTRLTLGVILALPLGANTAGFIEAQEWTQNFILDFKSGYTEGPLGFGVDPADKFGRIAISDRLRVSKTELRAGEWSWCCRSCAPTTVARCRRPSRAPCSPRRIFPTCPSTPATSPATARMTTAAWKT